MSQLPSDDYRNMSVLQLHDALHALRAEHRDLDQVILHLTENPSGDELQVRRLKKRKLELKDRINFIEHLLDPDQLA